MIEEAGDWIDETMEEVGDWFEEKVLPMTRMP